MKLNALKVSGKHPKWCGPSALSIITGRTVNYCAKLCAEQANATRHWLRKPHTSRSIKGVYNDEMTHALHKMGFEMTGVDVPWVNCRAPTLRAYMAGRGGAEWKGVMLVNVTSHYVVIQKDTVSDNHQQDKHYTEHRYRRKKIDKAWLITRRPRRKMA
jgi:hypothetical protein